MTKNQKSLLARLTAILKFIEGEDGSERPKAVIRPYLPDALRVTQAELLDALGVKNKSELSKKLRHAVVVVSQVHTRKYCFRTMKYAAAHLHAALEDRFGRQALQERLRHLGGEMPPIEISIRALQERVRQLRDQRVNQALELKNAFDVLSKELGEDDPVHFLRIREMEDIELIENIERLQYSVNQAGDEVVRTEKSRENARRDARRTVFERRWGPRYSEDHFHSWCSKHYDREDALRKERLKKALTFVSIKERKHRAA